MTAPYSFTRRTDGVEQTIYAEHINELQTAIEELDDRGDIGFSSSRIYGAETLYSFGAVSVASVSADNLYAQPFRTGPSGITVNTVNIRVNSTGTATAARIGMYTASTSPPYYPEDLVSDWGTVDVSTNGQKSISLSSQEIVGLAPTYMVWLVVILNGTSSLYVTQSAGNRYLGQGTVSVGASSAGVTRSFSYAALPDPYGTPALLNQTPMISFIPS